MKILITGAQGMLGSMLGQVFADQKPELWDIGELDITNQEHVRTKIDAQRPHVIINAAAYTDVDGAEKNRESAFAINAHAVRHLARTAKEIGATFVHYSTDYVFPGGEEQGYDEDDEPGPAVNTYGESKLAGERAVREAGGLSWYLIRTAWLFGPNGKNFVTTMQRLASEKTALTVVNDQWGCPTYTKDLAVATRSLLERYPHGVYHVTNQGVTTWFEFAKEILALSGASTPVRPVGSHEFPRKALRPRYGILRNTKGPPTRPWQEALKEYIESQ